MKKGLLLINIGSPEAPTKAAVSTYLKAFLNDPKVMDMPALFRKTLVNGIIIPFRAKKSATRYQQLWTPQGSPLTYHLKDLKDKLTLALKDEYRIFTATSYTTPRIAEVLKEIEKENLTSLTVLPLYPHYSQSTTESAIEEVKKATHNWETTSVRFIQHFYSHPSYVQAVAQQANDINIKDFHHVLFSYHSLPLKQIEKTKKMASSADYDYNKACHRTSELLAQALHIEKNHYSTAFQSRFSKRWQAPYTNDILNELAHDGKKKIVVFTPSFVADCLETSVEIGLEYRDEFMMNGGEILHLVPCPNASDVWVKGICDLI